MIIGLDNFIQRQWEIISFHSKWSLKIYWFITIDNKQYYQCKQSLIKTLLIKWYISNNLELDLNLFILLILLKEYHIQIRVRPSIVDKSLLMT